MQTNLRFPNTMNARQCFLALLGVLRPDVVFDIGSRNGKDALRFSHILPAAKVVAIEAHPLLAERMQRSGNLSEAGVVVYSTAISNEEGQVFFSVFHPQKNTGSILEHLDKKTIERFRVSARRLDSFNELINADTAALWIDAEGISYEVLEGVGEYLSKVQLVLVEVEKVPLWQGQKTVSRVSNFLIENGFSEVGGCIKSHKKQGNLVFIQTSQVTSRTVRCAIHKTIFFHSLSLLASRLRLKERTPYLFKIVAKHYPLSEH